MSMDCRRWDELYDAWREGRLSTSEAEACLRHAETCPRCGDLLGLLDDVVAGDAPDLSAAILARTSGSPCGRARGLMGGRPDDGLDDAESALLASHLEHCVDCAELDRILGWLPETLPTLAEVEPDETLVYDVLRATSATRARRRSGALGRLRERTGAWWGDQVRRPLFAWEVAFTATVLAVLFFGTPLSPGRGAPEQALDVIKAAPVWTGDRTADLIDAAGDAVVAMGDGLEAVAVRTGPARHDLTKAVERTGRALGRGDFEEFLKAGAELDDAVGALFGPSRRDPDPDASNDDDHPPQSGSS